MNNLLNTFLKKVGSKIRAARKSQPLSQREVAKRARISYRYYQRIEAGKANITMATLIRLAYFYKIHPCDLLPTKIDL